MKNRDELYPYADGSRYCGKSNAEVFGEIFSQATWNLTHRDSVSGEGSNAEQTARLRAELPALLQQLGVKRVLDVPCGDFYWMQQLDLSSVNYIGGDIVPELISRNQQLYSNDKRNFVQLDLTCSQLPDADLVFCRDCLVHLSIADIRKALTNVVRSKATWMLMTHFTNETENKDIITGGWRPLNFCQPPFCLPEPTAILNEGCTEMNGAFQDKSMGCWEVKQIKNLAFLNSVD